MKKVRVVNADHDPAVPLHHAPEEEYTEIESSLVICELAAAFAVITLREGRKAHSHDPVPLPPLMPPLRYHIVESGIHRGGYPVLCNFRFMKRLNLRTIISLIPDDPTQDLKDFCAHENIDIMYIQSEKFKESPVLYTAEVTQVLEVLIDTSKHPVYLHCLDGAHNAGSVVIALRKLQGWDRTSITAEHFRWTNDREITSDERRYIDEFHSSCQLILPSPMPRWLWGGTFLGKDGIRKRSKAFSRLQYPNPVGEEIKLETRNASAVVGSLDTLYDTREFLSETLAPFPEPSREAAKYDPLWAKEVRGSGGVDGDMGVRPRVDLSRQMQALWLDPGPASDAYISEIKKKSPPRASSYSDLSSMILI